jgi:MarC family membrane protein
MKDWKAYAEIATALFVIADPIGAVPAFISFTAGYTPDRKHTARLAVQTVGMVFVLSTFLGEPILRLVGVSLAAFEVGGGILVLLMAIAMIQARPSRARRTPEEAEEAHAKEEVGVIPLGIPLVAGPGAISTIIIYAHQAANLFDIAFLLVVSLFVASSVWIALRLADPIERLFGKTGINIVTRLSGLILTAVAVEFITQGLAALLPGLAKR